MLKNYNFHDSWPLAMLVEADGSLSPAVTGEPQVPFPWFEKYYYLHICKGTQILQNSNMPPVVSFQRKSNLGQCYTLWNFSLLGKVVWSSQCKQIWAQGREFFQITSKGIRGEGETPKHFAVNFSPFLVQAFSVIVRKLNIL